jgi:hypothetical protein
MDTAFKTQGWSQGIFKVSATKRELFGALRILPDGRKFRYGKAGGTLVAGGMCIMAEAVTNHIQQVQTSGAANAVGATVVTVYVGATAVTADQYKDGFLQVYDGAAGTTGVQYRISSHGVSAAGSEAISVTLVEPIQVATIVSDTFSLIPNPWSSCTHTTGKAHGAAGIAMKAASSGEYLWFQTGGPAICKAEGTAALGSEIGISNTTQEIELAAAYTDPTVGFVIGVANAAGKWSPVFLTID